MGIFGFGTSSSLQVANHKSLVADYERLRPVRMRLNHQLVQRLSTGVLREGAKKIGMLHRDVFVFDTEDESAVLMDYCIYNVYRKGRNAIDQYLCDCPPDPESDEMLCLRAMQHATYALIVVHGVEPGVGCHVRNLFTDETHLLVDMGLSKTGQRGGIAATRLLDFGEYVATGGASLPLGILDEAQLDEWQRKLRAGIRDDNFDPASLIRECLRRGTSSDVFYEEPGAQPLPEARATMSRIEDPAKRKRQLAARRSNKGAGSRRCRCGSGKMVKNCCGKH